MSYPKGVPGRTYKPPVSPAWASAIEDYLKTIAAVGQRPETMKLRRLQLQQMARELRCAPGEVTGELLVGFVRRQRALDARDAS